MKRLDEFQAFIQGAHMTLNFPFHSKKADSETGLDPVMGEQV